MKLLCKTLKDDAKLQGYYKTTHARMHTPTQAHACTPMQTHTLAWQDDDNYMTALSKLLECTAMGTFYA